MADLGFFTSSGEKISKSESEKRFPKKSSSSSSSSTPKLTFENAPAGYTKNPDGTIRQTGTFKSTETVTQTIQNVGSPRTQVQPTATPIKTLATEEVLQRATNNPDQFNREVIEQDRNRRVKEDIKRIAQEEITKGVTITPESVGQAKTNIENRELITPTRDLFNRADNFIANSKIIKVQNAIRKPVKDAFPFLIQKLDKRQETFQLKSERAEPGSFERFDAGAESFTSGAIKGVLNVGNVLVNPERTIVPVLSYATSQPGKFLKEVNIGLASSGSKLRIAGAGQTGAFVGETIAGGGVETAFIRNIVSPAYNFVSAVTSKNFIPLTKVPVKKTVSVNPFTRTNTKVRKVGDVLPDEYLLATDDYLFTQSNVKGFTREVPTGETQLTIEKVPSSKEPFDIKIVGGVDSNAEDLATQFGKAGTEKNLVSAQRGLVQPADNVFGGLVNKADININKPSPDPLERSLFFSSEPELRLSRLGIDGDSAVEPNFIDLATENFGAKSEILIKPQTKIAEFPSNLQKGADFIIEKGKQLPGETLDAAVGRTRKQLELKFPGFEKKITEFQLRTKGEPTTPGFFSREQEVIFSAGQTGRAERTATTFIGGKKIKIFEETGLNPAPTSQARINILTENAGFVDSVGDSFVRNLIEQKSRPAPRVIKSPPSPSVSSSLNIPSSTTNSFSGLEVQTTPVVQSKSSSPSTSLSKRFIPPSQPSYKVTPTRELVIPSSPISPAPRVPRRSGKSRRSSNPSSPFPSIPSPQPSIPSSPNRNIRSPARPSPYTPRRNTLNPTTPFGLIPKFKPRSSRGSSFTTQVLKKGKFVSVGRSTTQEKAFNLGDRVVGGSALRSFRILKGGTPVSLTSTRRFRRSKSKSSTVVERNKFAINTPGEIFEIPGSKKRKRRNRR